MTKWSSFYQRLASLSIVKPHWQWWLLLSFVLLLPTKNLCNLPIALMALAGLVMLVRGHPNLPERQQLWLLFVLFGCIWLPMVISLPDATSLSHSAATTGKFLRFPFMGVFVLVALRDRRTRR